MKLTRRTLVIMSATVFSMADAGSVVHVTTDSEPGERLVVTGRIMKSDARTPARGVTLSVYQTDAAGIYGKGSGHPEQIARLRGKLVTGADGRYEIVTIRPGHYPGGGVPAHIHASVDGVVIPEFLFAGDPYLKSGQEGYVMQVRRDSDGIWRGSRDIVLR